MMSSVDPINDSAQKMKYEQSRKHYIASMQKKYQTEFQEEVKKKLYLDPALIGDAFLNQSKLVMESLQNQIRLIELIYKTHLEERIIEGLSKEKDKLYQLQLVHQEQSNIARKELEKYENHVKAIEDKLKNNESDSDLQSDLTNAKDSFCLARIAYSLKVEKILNKIYEMEKMLQEKEKKIIEENQPLLEDNNDRLRAVADHKNIQEQLVMRNQQKKDKPEIPKLDLALASKQNSLSASAVSKELATSKSGILLSLHPAFKPVSSEVTAKMLAQLHDSKDATATQIPGKDK